MKRFKSNYLNRALKVFCATALFIATNATASMMPTSGPITNPGSVLGNIEVIRSNTDIYVPEIGSSTNSVWIGSISNPHYTSEYAQVATLTTTQVNGVYNQLVSDFHSGRMNGGAISAINNLGNQIRTGNYRVSFNATSDRSFHNGTARLISIGMQPNPRLLGDTLSRTFVHEADHLQDAFPTAGNAGQYVDELLRNFTSTYGDLGEAYRITAAAYDELDGHVRMIVPDLNSLNGLHRFEVLYQLHLAEMSGQIPGANLTDEALAAAREFVRTIDDEGGQHSARGLARLMLKNGRPLGQRFIKILPFSGLVIGGVTICASAANGDFCQAGRDLLDTLIGEIPYFGSLYDALILEKAIYDIAVNWRDGRIEAARMIAMTLFNTIFDDQIKPQLQALLDRYSILPEELRELIEEMLKTDEITPDQLIKFAKLYMEFLKSVFTPSNAQVDIQQIQETQL